MTFLKPALFKALFKAAAHQLLKAQLALFKSPFESAAAQSAFDSTACPF